MHETITVYLDNEPDAPIPMTLELSTKTVEAHALLSERPEVWQKMLERLRLVIELELMP